MPGLLFGVFWLLVVTIIPYEVREALADREGEGYDGALVKLGAGTVTTWSRVSPSKNAMVSSPKYQAAASAKNTPVLVLRRCRA